MEEAEESREEAEESREYARVPVRHKEKKIAATAGIQLEIPTRKLPFCIS